MLTKWCSKCKDSHLVSSFHKNKNTKDGLARWCKECVKANSKQWYDKTPREKQLVTKRAWQEKNREYVNAYNNAWQKANPEKHAAREAKRRAKKLSATPSWLTGPQRAQINRTYKLAHLMREITGKEYHVDHIAPLNGENICGLHVPWNLQVIQARDNLSKSNKFEG